MFHSVARITPLRRAYYRLKMAQGIHGQSDEGSIIRDLCGRTGAPRTFVEFGFHPIEFNCASLVADHQGLLIDGSSRQVADARALLPSNIRIENRFLDLDNLDIVRDAFPELGVLSIDIDGNDYWFLEKLITLNPSVISVEYNASFLDHPVTVPYDPNFRRNEKHDSGWYHGASIVALTKLAARFGYGLAAVSSGGMNAFFTRDGSLDPRAEWKPNVLRDRWSNTTADQQWERIKHLDLVWV